MVNVAIMGYGVVGSGVVDVITQHSESLAQKAKEEISIKYILDIRDFPDSPFADKFTKSFDQILNDDEVRIVVEVMGGLKPAYDFAKSCLLAGKSVVTSNKELVAAKGAELLKIAQEKNVNFLFEASVGGGIPIIRPMTQCLAANDVIEIAGILNGTTNFILTKMIRDKMEFNDALLLAQQLGYAERNPAADIEGHDACRKICILAAIAYGKHVYPESVKTEGITNITLEDVAYADSWGGVIKLIGQAKILENGKLEIFVAPMFISRESQLSSVDDVFNGILVRGDETGDIVFYGKGAGKYPTASAVVADVVDCVKHFKARKYLGWEDTTENYVADYNDYKFSAYLRCISNNDRNAVEKAKSLFGDIQIINRSNQPENEFAFISPVKSSSEIDKAISALAEYGIETISKIRVGEV